MSEIVKPVSLAFHLQDRLGNRMILQFIGLSKDFFREEPASNCGSALPDSHVDALFRQNVCSRKFGSNFGANTVSKDVCHVKVF